MTRKVFVAVMVVFLVLVAGVFVQGQEKGRNNQEQVEIFQEYQKVVQKTVGMVGDSQARKLAGTYGLNILNVTWEDTGRYKNSSVGPNISDMTIQVQLTDPRNQQSQLFLMPVIRFPNFSDKTCDVKMEDFYLLVGNEKGHPLKKVHLREFLGNMREYLSEPESWKGKETSLLAERDTHVLVSAQACFLPIPQKGIAKFNPVLFNYQSYKNNPAVLTILATREGTSVTIIDNQRDGFHAGRTWGQRLFFNKEGERASLTGERLSDFLDGQKDPDKPQQKPAISEKDQEGLNMVLLIQVPLKHQALRRKMYSEMPMAAPSSGAMDTMAKEESDVESAVIGHGEVEGPFTEIDGLAIERDPRFPVRVTVQFYKATSNGVVSDKDLAGIAAQINRVYADADYVGSLVVDGETHRPTEYEGDKIEPENWWRDFWNQYEKEHGQSRYDAIKMLRQLMGPFWTPGSRRELEEKMKEIKQQ